MLAPHNTKKSKAAKRKKRSFTLIECVIAFSLTSVLVFVLFSFYRQNTLLNIASATAKKIVLQRRHIQQRLIQVFKTAALPTEDKKNALWTFHTDSYEESMGPALYFTYNNGIDPDPAFCHHVKAVLYLDLKKNLCLTTLSSKEEKRKEILLPNVLSLEFSFFETSHNKWSPFWKEKEEDLPAFCKLILKESSHPDRLLEFAFVLSEANQEIVYQKKEGL